MPKRQLPGLLLGLLALTGLHHSSEAQQITGVWKGKINKNRVELKMILNGDSLIGTSYYYASAANYRRYSIKGHFDNNTNQVVWWDDQLIEERSGKLSLAAPGSIPMLSRADFNCPGGGAMMLDGNTTRRQEDQPGGPLHLEKSNEPVFPDEWDFVIDNYTTGANDPWVIDSIALIAFHPNRQNIPVKERPSEHVARTKRPAMVSIPPMREKDTPPLPKPQEPKPEFPRPQPAIVSRPQSIEEKFTIRKKVFTTEIPVTGDSIELRFYDNAEIDGDSISLFLNDKLLFTHIRLTDKAYTIKLPVASLNESNELIMVAENLGSIPPNTSYMVAIVQDKRYEAKLASTENSSAMIRLRKSQ